MLTGGFFFLAVLKDYVDFDQVDWSGRHEDSSKMNCTFSRAWAYSRKPFNVLRECKAKGDPAGAVVTRRLPDCPKVREVPGAEINNPV
ncbi:hypothetical protein SAMN05192533_11471 [Mesobacillus persicus]|uniref:Uncharacterized protein n=1 Tax=Mesobacillus persicus TaxID=930146 RepID=A0A1H8H2Z3_9BACI|nr:hypothetical protein SAMN05192533_11471 [Mesobacillus persicus]